MTKSLGLSKQVSLRIIITLVVEITHHNDKMTTMLALYLASEYRLEISAKWEYKLILYGDG